MFTFIKVHGHELILKCSLIIIINFISQTWQIKSVYQIWKKSLYLEKYSGLFRYLLPLHCTWRCAYQDRVEPACTGPPVFYTQESPQIGFVARYHVGKLGLAIIFHSLHLPLFAFIVRIAKAPFPVTWKTQALLLSILNTRIRPPPERLSVMSALGRYIPVGACSMLPLYVLRVLNHVSFIPNSPPRSVSWTLFC